MSKKTKNAKPLPPINVGDRVRHPNGTEGTVTATSGAKVTIAWPNEETTTWEASYLRIRGIKVIGDEPATEAPVYTTRTLSYTEHTSMPAPPVEEPTAEASPATELIASECDLRTDPATAEQPAAEAPPASEPSASECDLREKPAEQPPAKPKTKKVSAIDAAAQVLAAAGQAMSCPDMIAAMDAGGLWKSPGGQTPAATLYSAILREINTKGDKSRFTKTERGKFAAKA